jgi:hypothetical protein
MLSGKAWTVLLLGAIALLLWGCLSVWPFTVDDSYIIFRYACNLAEGHGPTFNPGGPPVEGLTCPLWMWLLSVPAWMSIDLIVASKVLGVLAMVVTLLILLRQARIQPGGVIAAVFAVGFLASFPPTFVHAVSGIGTALFTLQVTMHLWLAQRRSRESSSVSGALLAFSALLLGLSRAEGNLVGFLSLSVLILQSRDRGLLRASVLFYLIPGSLYFGLRWMYYGLPFPLPTYIKLWGGDNFDVTVPSGFAEAWRFVTGWGLGLALPFVLGLFRLDRSFLPALVAGGVFLLFCLIPAQIMGYEWRFFFPLLPFLLLIAGFGVQVVFDWIQKKIKLAPLMAASVTLLLVLPAFYQNGRTWGPTQATWRGYAQGLQVAHLALGQRLHEFPGKHGIFVIGDAGAVPYASGWETLDSFGLNEPSIATTGRHDPEPILARKPGLIVLISNSPVHMDPPLAWEKDLYDAALARGFALAGTLEFAPTYHLWLMARPGSELHRWLEYWPKPLSDHGAVELFPASPRVQVLVEGCRRIATGARYSNGFEIREVWLGEDRLVIDLVAGEGVKAPLQVFVHARSQNGQKVERQYDFAPSIPIDAMRQGETYRIWKKFDPALPSATQEIHLGIFESATKGWPRWTTRAGKDHVRIEMERAR